MRKHGGGRDADTRNAQLQGCIRPTQSTAQQQAEQSTAGSATLLEALDDLDGFGF